MVFHGRDSKYDLELGGERVHTYGGGEAVTILEIGERNYALLKLNTLDNPPVLPAAPKISMEGEDVAVRQKRQKTTWIKNVIIYTRD
ncbi:MAG: hypothetical protein V3S70_00850 [Gammaproteobacteria bacterium]